VKHGYKKCKTTRQQHNDIDMTSAWTDIMSHHDAWKLFWHIICLMHESMTDESYHQSRKKEQTIKINI
ncbi:MAG: hypothetical protein K2I52_06280, partial [Muribaculaceae bacterium]|nr:hypothetical protein [Muribaculaceae bacterium]